MTQVRIGCSDLINLKDSVFFHYAVLFSLCNSSWYILLVCIMAKFIAAGAAYLYSYFWYVCCLNKLPPRWQPIIFCYPFR